jgi:predicted metallopeptidase
MGEVSILDDVRPPLVLRWDTIDSPLPVRPVRSHHGTRGAFFPSLFGRVARPSDPLDFSNHVERLCRDIVARCPEFAHVRTEQVLFGFTQARNRRTHGLQARVTPMRLHGGRLVRRHRGVPYQVQRFIVDGVDVLYLMTFCLPRFLNQPFEDNLVTLFHELFHIGPQFDGDLRRHGGRYAVHTHSQRLYDQHVAKLARAYLATNPDPKLNAFLRLSFSQLRRRHGEIVGIVVPRPKLVPVPMALV